MLTNKLLWNSINKYTLVFICLCILGACSSSGNRNSESNNLKNSIGKRNSSKLRNNNEFSIVSWNLNNFGYSKDDNKIDFIARTISDYDIIALQEVVGKSGGADAVIRLVNRLNDNCQECQWDYDISKLTSGNPQRRERYAYLWKGVKVRRVGLGHLEENYNEEIEREPFLLTFRSGEKEFTLVNFHALPKGSHPESEIKYFKFLPDLYSNKLLIFLGDFNVPQTHTVFNPLKKMGYQAALTNQKTTLRQKCLQGDCLASEYDNIFYPTQNIQLIEAKIIHFYEQFEGDMKKARRISDHVPVVLRFSLN